MTPGGAAPGERTQYGVCRDCVGGGDGVIVREGLDDVTMSESEDFLLYSAAASAWRRIVELRGPLSC